MASSADEILQLSGATGCAGCAGCAGCVRAVCIQYEARVGLCALHAHHRRPRRACGGRHAYFGSARSVALIPRRTAGYLPSCIMWSLTVRGHSWIECYVYGHPHDSHVANNARWNKQTHVDRLVARGT